MCESDKVGSRFECMSHRFFTQKIDVRTVKTNKEIFHYLIYYLQVNWIPVQERDYSNIGGQNKL